MKRRSIAYIAAVVGLVAVAWVPAGATNESQAAVLGLLYRPGAREVALGGAGVAGAKGPAASYYNPALLAWQTGPDGRSFPRLVGSTYYKILQNFGLNDMYYMYFPAAFSISDWGQFSLDVTYLSLGEQTRTDEFGRVLGTFYTFTAAVGLSYASKISDNTSAGLTAKWFYDRLADAGQGAEKGKPVGTGFAFDAGMAYRPAPRLMFGAALRNYGPNVQYIDANQASPTPINFNIGTSIKVIDTEYNDITFVGDLYKPLVQDFHRAWYLAPIRGWFDENVYKVDEIDNGQGGTTRIEHKSYLREETRQMDIHTGIEYTYADYVALRTGFYRDWDGQRRWLTFGAGFRLPISSAALTVDFGYVKALDSGGMQDPNDGQQVYSIGVTF